MKEELAVSQGEKTENQAEQNKSHAVAGIEAHPSPPHCCFFRNDRRSLAHADLQRGVTGRELRPQERIDEVDDSEREDDARTENHENFCCQDALPILTQGFNYCTALRAGELRFEELGEGLSSPPPRRSISCTSSPSRFPRARSALMSPNTLHFFCAPKFQKLPKLVRQVKF